MKMITCIVRPEKLDALANALAIENIVGMTVTDVRGYGKQKGQVEHYRGGEYVIRFVQKVKVEILVKDDHEFKVLEVLSNVARTGKVGDGKVYVVDVTNAMRIRTGETGESAL